MEAMTAPKVGEAWIDKETGRTLQITHVDDHAVRFLLHDGREDWAPPGWFAEFGLLHTDEALLARICELEQQVIDANGARAAMHAEAWRAKAQAAEMRAALQAAEYFVHPEVSRGPAVDRWVEMRDLVAGALGEASGVGWLSPPDHADLAARYRAAYVLLAKAEPFLDRHPSRVQTSLIEEIGKLLAGGITVAGHIGAADAKLFEVANEYHEGCRTFRCAVQGPMCRALAGCREARAKEKP